MKLLLGIDAATTKSGISVLDYNKNIIMTETLKTNSKEYVERLHELYISISSIIEDYPNIDTIILEDVPINYGNNLKVAKELSSLQGLILSLSFKYGIKVKLYNPSAHRSLNGMYNGTRESTKRDFQKQAAVDLINSMYNLDFKYFKSETKNNITDDDKAESICLCLAYLKEIENKEEL